ncbi:glycosyltransferase family 2 protein [Micromonospora sp. CA-263727]|uniref:glycosyltransferase family 2 protein n=1 Tax=Micromonospora sp. CA-263727 TaxID=3239967 RepID=UPI003D8B8A8B
MTPRVTVLMPVHNAADYVEAAIGSVLRQTYRDLELLVVDDGSTDRTEAVVASITDPRLRVLHRPRAGIVASLNAGLDEARGELLARMDADDVMGPERLARQVAYLDRNPEVVACGTDYELFGAMSGRVRMPRTPAACRARLLFGTCIAHSSAAIRLAALRSAGIRYRPEYGYAEDYRLFTELSQHGDLANLPYVGLRYRVADGQVSATRLAEQRATTLRIMRENLAGCGVSTVDDGTLARMIWLDGRGVGAAWTYLYREAPHLFGVAARAAGLHGARTAVRLIRERLNTALRPRRRTQPATQPVGVGNAR